MLHARRGFGKNQAYPTSPLFAAGDAARTQSGSSSVVYLGHIPHGFYEEQMKGYFSQFGDVVTFVFVCRESLQSRSARLGSLHWQTEPTALCLCVQLRLRLSRNKKTGASRHFAFIEFEDAEVRVVLKGYSAGC
jgi:nucleolar protein 15